MTAIVFGDASSVALAKPVSGYQDTRAQLVAAGLHPTGRPLARDDHPGHGHTCGDCALHYVRQFARRYHKCKLIPATGGPATDIKIRWPACEKWQAEPEEVAPDER